GFELELLSLDLVNLVIKLEKPVFSIGKDALAFQLRFRNQKVCLFLSVCLHLLGDLLGGKHGLSQGHFTLRKLFKLLGKLPYLLLQVTVLPDERLHLGSNHLQKRIDIVRIKPTQHLPFELLLLDIERSYIHKSPPPLILSPSSARLLTTKLCRK